MTQPTRDPLAQFLVRRGLLSAEAVHAIQSRLGNEFKPVGRILLEERHVTFRQLAGLMQLQLSEPHMLLGELAVREGYICEAELADVLNTQRLSCPHILELALTDYKVDPIELMHCVADYIRHTEHILAALGLSDLVRS